MRRTHLGGHDEARGSRVDGDISRHESNVSKIGEELSVLLVGQSLPEPKRETSASKHSPPCTALATHLNRTSVYHSLPLLQALSDGVFGHDGLSGRGVSRDEDRLVALDRSHRHLLEGIQLEWVGAGGLGGRYVGGNGNVGVVGREGDLVTDLWGPQEGG